MIEISSNTPQSQPTQPSQHSQPGQFKKLPDREVIQLSKFDRHNLELKSNIDFNASQLTGSTELFFFLPKSSLLMSDFHSRLRLSETDSVTAESLVLIKEIAKLQRLVDFLEVEALAGPTNYEIQLEKIFNLCRHLGALFGEMIKVQLASHKKHLLMIHSLSNPLAEAGTSQASDFRNLLAEIEDVNRHMIIVRGTLESAKSHNVPVLNLLDRYLSSIYSEYLDSLHEEFLHYGKFSELLERCQGQEAVRVRATSQMKKFFQPQTFIEISTFVDVAQRKVRFPDWLRTFLTNWLAPKFFPDLERNLFAEGEHFGFVKDWFSIKKDFLHYRREFNVRSRHFSMKGNRRGLNEVLRINLERHLKTENFSHFYVGLSTTLASNGGPAPRLYRVIVDENGIDRVEPA